MCTEMTSRNIEERQRITRTRTAAYTMPEYSPYMTLCLPIAHQLQSLVEELSRRPRVRASRGAAECQVNTVPVHTAPSDPRAALMGESHGSLSGPPAPPFARLHATQST